MQITGVKNEFKRRKPVNDNRIKEFLQNCNPTTDLYNENIAEEFKQNF